MVDDIKSILVSRESATVGKPKPNVYSRDLHVLRKILAVDQGIGYLDFAVY
jgi:hypothetical protein